MNAALAVAPFFWVRLAVIYGEHDPVVPSSPAAAQARREAARELAAFADALDGRAVVLPTALMQVFPDLTEADVQADRERENARANNSGFGKTTSTCSAEGVYELHADSGFPE
jgi:hypothetical protein